MLAYITLGGLSGAIYNEVLQFFVILAGLIPIVIVGLAGGAVGIMAGRLAFNLGDDEQALTNFVSSNRKPGDLYFLPVDIPNLAATTRGWGMRWRPCR